MQIQTILAAAAALALLTSAHAQKPEAAGESAATLFNTALSYLVNADAERDKGSAEDAAILYKEAAEKYSALALRFPDWQPAVTRYRIAYCNEQLAGVKKQVRSPGAASASPPPAAPEKAAPSRQGGQRAMKARAADLLLESNPDGARTVLLDALPIDPDDAGVRLMLAIAQCQAAAYSDAASIMAQLIEEEPTNAIAHMVLGAAYVGQGRFKEAEGVTSIALTLNAKDPSGHYNMARILLQMSPPDRENAKLHYRKFLDLGGMPDPALEAALESSAAPAPSSSGKSPVQPRWSWRKTLDAITPP